jgi:asparagine synthase (glutamine-hydrolysing)
VSGILGVWNLDGRPVEDALLRTLSARLAHRGLDREGLWIEGPVGLGCQLFCVTPESQSETQPLVRDGVAVVFDGRLDDRDELLRLLEGVPADAPDSELVLAAYQCFGELLPEKLNGDFALAVWDRGERRLLLARDSIGVRPVYYCRAGEAFLFASEIKAILAHPGVRTRPNDETLADWVLRFPGEDHRGLTFFEGVFSLPPAHTALLTGRGLRVRRYWDFDKTRRLRLPSFRDYAEAFRVHFDRAIRRRLRSQGPVAMSVSGGLDSSSMFCWAETLRRASPGCLPPVRGFTRSFPAGTPASEERFVAEIERQYQTPIQRIPAVPVGFLEAAEDEVRCVECPVLNLQWHSDSVYLETIRQQGLRLVLTGHWGDQFLAGRVYLVDQFLRGDWGLVWRYIRGHPKRFRRNFPRWLAWHLTPASLARAMRRMRLWRKRPSWDAGWFAASFRKRILERDRQWTRFGGPFSSAHARALYQEVRARYHVVLLEWSNKVAAHHGLEAAYPFLDRDLIQFLMAIPGDAVSSEDERKRILRRALGDVLPAAVASRRDKGRLGEWINTATAQEYDHLLHRLDGYVKIHERGYVNRCRCGDIFGRLRQSLVGRNVRVAAGLRDLVGLELWLQVFQRELTE